MGNLFNIYLYSPILSALIFVYEKFAFHDLGLAIIIVTVLVRIVLFPVFYKGAKDQSLLQRLQPQIKKIQTDHKDDKERQAREMMALYKTHKLNPFSGFFLLLLQLPVFIVLFRIFTKELSNPAFSDTQFLNIIDLGAKSLIVAIIAAALQYAQGKLALPPKVQDEHKDPAAKTGRMMAVIAPFFTLMILINLPSALGVYWIVSSLFSIGQQAYINKKINRQI